MKITRRKIGAGLVILGLVLISIPLYHEYTQAKEKEALEEAFSLISSGEQAVDAKKMEDLPVTKEEVSGIVELEIPSIDLSEKVLPETTPENLNLALTQIRPDQAPGKGNFTIAGHRGYRGERFFSKLPAVPTGEEVLLHQDGETFVYEVTGTEVVEPTAVEVLEDQEGKKEITMITCTWDGSDRVVLKGQLIEHIQ
ncbi:class D sortase [Salimicrobium flavidum]|uniref:Sortase A n=1 Tax=Salimicrobium flavidum TaxID=570947 RepID=A0A1N7KTU7_9BACI|nr:class D sortase [Salimicrobium flavidum]SIS64916.1 sortase A [Salimicrobium flavidum]